MKLRPIAAALPLLLASLGHAQTTEPTVSAQNPATTSTVNASPSAPTDTEPKKLRGALEDGRYHAPGNIFSVAVPVLHGDKTVIMDNGEIVVFKDKVATLLTIAAFKLPPFEQWQHDTTEPREYLIGFFRDNILRDYDREFPGSSLEGARFLPGFQGGALVTFTLLPGGSAFEPIEQRPPTSPAPVAKRGHIVFVRDNYVFVVATELAERVTRGTAYTLKTGEEDRILFDRLINVLAVLRFGADEQPSGVELPPAS